MSEEQGLTPYETREILFYKTENGEVRVEILLFQENLWLTQAKMAELFEVQKAAISKHLKNIFASGELSEDSVVSKMETTAADGKRYQTNYYNLDAFFLGNGFNWRVVIADEIEINVNLLLTVDGSSACGLVNLNPVNESLLPKAALVPVFLFGVLHH